MNTMPLLRRERIAVTRFLVLIEIFGVWVFGEECIHCLLGTIFHCFELIQESLSGAHDEPEGVVGD